MRRLPRWGMIGCLTLEWVALAVWVGGMVVLSGAVIPAVFNTFGAQDSGGMLLTRAFEGYHRFVIGACVILSAAVWYRRWSGDPIVAVGRSEMIVLAIMVLIAGLIMMVLHPNAVALQAQAFATKDETARKTTLEALFRVLMPIRSLYMVNLVLGIVLVAVKVNRSLDLNRRQL
ncbi:MAG: DUF4149 domain-containing protein [Nitrospira sp.]|nr:DUF4149 domain-containing protein [Nitrospira sp.]MDH4251383.1 DUF4149 domain-containing protein [Nitrospira sp.]MDH4343686.1 DUF4149 domain-containing protein [Nitrospira sp.]MDH5336891.1 DUF4149 domain-containing protein [Nitrospira sp.]